MGPMTGRGAGFCAGAEMPGYASGGGGRGRGFRGHGGGRGWRNMFFATGLTGWQRAAAGSPPAWNSPPDIPLPTKEQERAALKQQAEYLEQALEELRKRMENLEAGNMDK